MRSLASLEGEYTIDNRATPGLTPEIVIAQGLPAQAARGLYQEKCYTCSHCESIVQVNRDRVRPRGYCKKCDHIICDNCEAEYVASGHICMPFKAFAEEYRNFLVLGWNADIARQMAIQHFVNKQFFIANP